MVVMLSFWFVPFTPVDGSCIWTTVASTLEIQEIRLMYKIFKKAINKIRCYRTKCNALERAVSVPTTVDVQCRYRFPHSAIFRIIFSHDCNLSVVQVLKDYFTNRDIQICTPLTEKKNIYMIFQVVVVLRQRFQREKSNNTLNN